MATIAFLNGIGTKLGFPALASTALLVPFVVLEVLNRRDYGEGFPFVLMGTLWCLPMVFLFLLMPIVRNVREGSGRLVLRVVSLALIAWLWGSIVLDQLPCFLGVPNCD